MDLQNMPHMAQHILTWQMEPNSCGYDVLGLGCVDAVQDLVHSAAGMAGLSRQRGLKKESFMRRSSTPPATIPTHSPGDPNTFSSREDVSAHDQSGAV